MQHYPRNYSNPVSFTIKGVPFTINCQTFMPNVTPFITSWGQYALNVIHYKAFCQTFMINWGKFMAKGMTFGKKLHFFIKNKP